MSTDLAPLLLQDGLAVNLGSLRDSAVLGVHEHLWPSALCHRRVAEHNHRAVLYKDLVHVLEGAAGGLGVDAEDDGEIAVHDDGEDCETKC